MAIIILLEPVQFPDRSGDTANLVLNHLMIFVFILLATMSTEARWLFELLFVTGILDSIGHVHTVGVIAHCSELFLFLGASRDAVN